MTHADTAEVWRNDKQYHFEWNEESIAITECCKNKEHEDCTLETYDFARIE